MRTKSTLLLIAGLGVLAPAGLRAQSADLRPMVVADLSGDLRIQQSLPATCDDVDQTTPVVQGRLEIAPGEDAIVVNGQRLFMLTQTSLSFAPFTVHRSCLTRDVTKAYTAVDVRLARAVSLIATPAGPGVYTVTVPKEKVLIYEASTVNGESEQGYKHAKEDVVGTINLGAGTVELVAKVATKIHIEIGCTPIGCIVNDDYSGTLTATILGHIVFPDTDGDGLPNRRDNCRLVPNPEQQVIPSPIIRAPENLTLNSCIYRWLGWPMAADLCDGGGVTISNNAPPRFVPGLNVVTWTAQDVHLRTATDAQNVTVVDATRPQFFPAPPGVSLTNCGPASLTLPSARDDCDPSLTFTNNAPASFPLGSTVVTWTARDDAGNPASANQTVTVTDLVRPSVSCLASFTSPGYFRAAASDACTASPTIRLGSFVLANGETFKLVASPLAGVRFLGYDAQRRRVFEVGPSNRVVSATDSSGNSKTATCSEPTRLP